MRKCWVAVFFALWVCACASLTGCGLLASFYEKPTDGGPSTAETVQSIVRYLPYGDILASIIGVGGVAFGANRHMKNRKTQAENKTLREKHEQLLQEGKKDDDEDGVDDALQAPTA